MSRRNKLRGYLPRRPRITTTHAASSARALAPEAGSISGVTDALAAIPPPMLNKTNAMSVFKIAPES